jgi:hypothetical protein
MLVPPGGWRFTVPQTGTSFGAPTYASLYHEACVDLEQHGIPVPLDYIEEFADALCHQIPSMECEVIMPATNETRSLTASDAIRFLRVLRTWAGVQGELVPQAEADRRSEICAGCRYNVAITGCSVCQGIAGKIAEIIGNRGTRFDSQLNGCAVCACENKAQVHLPLEVLQKGVTPEMAFPIWCWKRIVPPAPAS